MPETHTRDDREINADRGSQWLETVPFAEGRLRTFFSIEPPKMMRAQGFRWEHEVRVALPWSYYRTDKTYPVLWITDNVLELALPVLLGGGGGIPIELILVSVGAPRIPMRDFMARRHFDFLPPEGEFFDGPARDRLRQNWLRFFSGVQESEAIGGDARFLDFLIDDVRPRLAAEYRMDAEDHGLIGVSHGGRFVAHALFARPGAFSRYICGSPSLNVGNYKVFEMEQEYAAEHDDLPAHVFLGAGENEITEDVFSGVGIVSSMVRLAETLSVRGYPSLRLTVKIFPGESHGTTWQPVLSWGVRSVWADKIRPWREVFD
jgi:predicted alpha/beta superfamily hydrolase